MLLDDQILLCKVVCIIAICECRLLREDGKIILRRLITLLLHLLIISVGFRCLDCRRLHGARELGRLNLIIWQVEGYVLQRLLELLLLLCIQVDGRMFGVQHAGGCWLENKWWIKAILSS